MHLVHKAVINNMGINSALKYLSISHPSTIIEFSVFENVFSQNFMFVSVVRRKCPESTENDLNGLSISHLYTIVEFTIIESGGSQVSSQSGAIVEEIDFYWLKWSRWMVYVRTDSWTPSNPRYSIQLSSQSIGGAFIWTLYGRRGGQLRSGRTLADTLEFTMPQGEDIAKPEWSPRLYGVLPRVLPSIYSLYRIH